MLTTSAMVKLRMYTSVPIDAALGRTGPELIIGPELETNLSNKVASVNENITKPFTNLPIEDQENAKNLVESIGLKDENNSITNKISNSVTKETHKRPGVNPPLIDINSNRRKREI